MRTLRNRVRDTVRGAGDAAAVPIEHALLAVLAVDGHVSTVFGWRELLAHRPAVRALTGRIERELPGLRPAWTESLAARRASG